MTWKNYSAFYPPTTKLRFLWRDITWLCRIALRAFLGTSDTRAYWKRQEREAAKRWERYFDSEAESFAKKKRELVARMRKVMRKVKFQPPLTGQEISKGDAVCYAIPYGYTDSKGFTHNGDYRQGRRQFTHDCEEQ